MKVRDIGEFELIEIIKDITKPPYCDDSVTLPNGDDCFAFKAKNQTLVTTDALVEDVHFVRNTFPPYLLGVKAAVSNLSDIASCGGTPKYALVSLILPRELEIEWILNFYKGLSETLSSYNTYIGGGNISKGNKISVTITLIGETDKPLSRSGAKHGDLVFVTGTLGDSYIGLKILLSKKDLKYLNKEESYLVMRHLSPTPRIEVGQNIKNISTSCIDISDGFLQDLGHILESSNVGVEIEMSKIPLSYEYMIYLNNRLGLTYENIRFFEYALNGGEDYELIFTVPPDKESDVESISNNLNVRITKVGKVIEGNSVSMTFNGKTLRPEDVFRNLGWKHF